MVDISITPLEEIEPFLEKWTGLFEHAGNACFFLSPAWMTAWLEGAPASSNLHIIEAGEEEQPVLLGVIAYPYHRRPPLIGMREAHLHETGNPDYDTIYIEYNEFLTARDGGADLQGAALAAVMKYFSGADSIIFRNVRAGFAAAIQETALAHSWTAKKFNEQPVFVVDLGGMPSTGNAFLDSLSKSLRTKTRRAIRRYEERGPLSFRIAESDAERDDAWRQMVELHDARWRALGKAGAFASRQLISFHQRLQQIAPDACELFRVYAGEDTVGVLYNFLHGDRVMNYQSGFRFESDNQITPGYVCHTLACQHYLANGFQTYDLLAGDAEYKRRLGKQSETLFSIALERPSIRIKARNFLKGLSAPGVSQKSIKHNDAP